MSLLTTAERENTRSAGDDKEIVSSARTRSCSFLGGCLEMKPVDSSATPYDSHFCGALNSYKSSFFLFFFFFFFCLGSSRFSCLPQLVMSVSNFPAGSLKLGIAMFLCQSKSGRANTLPA